MNRVKRYGKYLVWSMIVLYVVFLVRCVPAKWWFKYLYTEEGDKIKNKDERHLIRRVGIFISKYQIFLGVKLSCLEQSLSSNCILRLIGVNVGVSFGCKNKNELVFHAWLNSNRYYTEYSKFDTYEKDY